MSIEGQLKVDSVYNSNLHLNLNFNWNNWRVNQLGPLFQLTFNANSDFWHLKLNSSDAGEAHLFPFFWQFKYTNFGPCVLCSFTHFEFLSVKVCHFFQVHRMNSAKGATVEPKSFEYLTSQIPRGKVFGRSREKKHFGQGDASVIGRCEIIYCTVESII